jgi:endonuclease G
MVPPGKWPDAVAVLGPQGSCTGTLIAPDVVLTAGHCAATNPTRVIANTTNYNVSGGTTMNVKSITAYPGWETSYDVAVIVLTQPIVGVTPRPIGTACSFDDFHRDTQIRLVGFGLTDDAGQGNNTQLNEAMAPVIDPDCSDGAGCVASVAPGGEFIAGGSGTDSCFGDSGGPVYLETARGTVVIGAVSRGLDGSATPCGGGGIYVRTDKIVEWIETTTGRTISKDSCGDGSDRTGDEDSIDPGSTIGGCATASGGAGRGAGIGGLAIVLGFVLRRRGR